MLVAAWGAAASVAAASGSLADVPAVYLTLKGSDDRAARFDRTFSSLGLAPTRLEVDRHPQGPFVGIFESHTRALRHLTALRPTSTLYAVFEDDALPSKYYSDATMDAIVEELASRADTFDIAYLGSVVWDPFTLVVPYGLPWHRVSPHVIDHAWSQMHALIYTRRGLLNTLPLLEAKLAGMVNGTLPIEQVDLYIESHLPQLARRQVVPYVFDQNWTQEIAAAPREDLEHGLTAERLLAGYEFREEGQHVWWSNIAYQVGADRNRFYIVLVLCISLGLALLVGCGFGIHRRWSSGRKDQADTSSLTDHEASGSAQEAGAAVANERTPLQQASSLPR